MKKTLLATAIAGALAASGAQAATVYNQDGTKLDIYGNVQIAYYNTDDGDESTDQLQDNGTTFGFAAEHVINSGLTGYLKLEIDDFDASNMATFDRSEQTGDTAYVGLKGNFGDVRIGSYDQLIDDWIQDPITNNEGFDVSDSTGSHGDGGDQQEDKVTYTSPSFNGLQFAVGTQYRGDGESETVDPDSYGFYEDSGNASFFGGAKYTAGAFSIAAVYDNLDNVQYRDIDGDIDSVGDQYGVTAQYTIDTLRLAAKVERFDSDVNDDLDTNFYGVSARYGYGMGDIYAAYQYVDLDADSFRTIASDAIDPDVDLDTGDDTFNEVILGANYSISDAMYVWTEYAMYDREDDAGDGVGVGVTYLF